MIRTSSKKRLSGYKTGRKRAEKDDKIQKSKGADDPELTSGKEEPMQEKKVRKRKGSEGGFGTMLGSQFHKIRYQLKLKKKKTEKGNKRCKKHSERKSEGSGGEKKKRR